MENQMLIFFPYNHNKYAYKHEIWLKYNFNVSKLASWHEYDST